MEKTRRRDRMKDDPVGDLEELKSGLDMAIRNYDSGETVTAGGMFPMPPKPGMPKAEAAPESNFGEMSVTERTKPPSLTRGTFNNDDVRALQSSLKDISAFMGDKSLDPGTVDADFGGNTKSAVKAFQNRFGLEVTGVADAKTLGEIRKAQSGLAMGKTVDPKVLDAQAAARADAVEQMRKVVRSGETELFPAPSEDRLKTSDTGLRGMSMADMRKVPLIERLLQLSADDQAVVADLLKSDTGM
jgi:peptidoglycan hydrolase-like protein with peptidoglycan-binding domain